MQGELTRSREGKATGTLLDCGAQWSARRRSLLAGPGPRRRRQVAADRAGMRPSHRVDLGSPVAWQAEAVQVEIVPRPIRLGSGSCGHAARRFGSRVVLTDRGQPPASEGWGGV